MDGRGVLARMLERLLRSLRRVVDWVTGRRTPVWEHVAPLRALERPAPPADWVERVQRGAPALLEPSVRDLARAAAPAPQPQSDRPAFESELVRPAAAYEAPRPAARRRPFLARTPVPHRRRQVPSASVEAAVQLAVRDGQEEALPHAHIPEPPDGAVAGRPEPDAVPVNELLHVQPAQPLPAHEPVPRQVQADLSPTHTPRAAAPSGFSVRASTPHVPTPRRESDAAHRPVPAPPSPPVPAAGVRDVPARERPQPWPALPDSVPAPPEPGLGAGLRAWAREQRLDREQSRL